MFVTQQDLKSALQSGVANVATPVRSLPANDPLREGFADPQDDTIPADLPEPSGVDSPKELSQVSVETPMEVSEGPAEPSKEVFEDAGDKGLPSPSSVSCHININILVFELILYSWPSTSYINVS